MNPMLWFFETCSPITNPGFSPNPESRTPDPENYG